MRGEIILFRLSFGKYGITRIYQEIRSFREWSEIQEFLSGRVGEDWRIVVY